MSSQRLSPGSSLLRSSSMVLSVALVSVLASCESEQTGYEVTIPLLGPTEFDQTSCEESGDLCSVETDLTDCTDEDGFYGGPCTKTMEELRPITVAVSLSPSNPSYTLPFEDTAGWTTLFLGQQFANGDLPEELQIDMTMDDFSVQGGPVTIAVRIFSRVGLIVGRNADYQPVTPSSCTFTLDDSATGQEYADGINTCLSDWITENGAPVDFDMEVTSSAGAAAKSEFAPKQAGEDYMVDGTWELKSNRQCEIDGTADALEAIREGDDFFAQLTCRNLKLEGRAQTDQDIGIIGGALVWDRCGNFSGAILPPTGLPGGDKVYTVTVENNVVGGDIKVVFIPTGVDFTESLLGAATGKCLSGSIPFFSEGRGLAGWVHCGPTPPPPRTGYIEVDASGFCSVDQGSASAGGSGQ